MFKDKNILFISSKFFGYENEIVKAIQKLGGVVNFYDDRPKNSFLYKAIIRVNKKFLKRKIEAYYKRINTEANKLQYDYVFFLKAESIFAKSLENLKDSQKKAKFILYLWDSIENRSDIKPLLKYFDKIWSFDKNDVKKYTSMSFRPLFYIDDYTKISKENEHIDICFIGTGHSDRYKIVQAIKINCAKQNISGYFFMYLQGVFMFYYRKLFSEAFRYSKKTDFNFTSLSKNEVIKIITSSKTVLDIQHNKQTGLTMRTLEVLGAKKKLITTNEDIINYDFYHPNNIYVIDRKNPKISKDFFELSYVEIDKAIYQKYSVSNWLIDVFN